MNTSAVKDPLVVEPTPWELLEIDPASRKAIAQRLSSGGGLAGPELEARIDREFRLVVDRAFTGALRKRVPPQKAKTARDTLLRPTGRVLVDLQRIPGEAFVRLTGPDGLAALAPAARLATARAWEAHFKEHLEDLECVHGLLALWWAWIRWEEERYRILAAASPRSEPRNKLSLIEQAHRATGRRFSPERDRCCADGDCPYTGDFRSSAPDLTSMWYALIGFAGLLCAERPYVCNRYALGSAEADKVLDGLADMLRNDLLDRAQALGSSVEARRYRTLELFLAEEIHVARVFKRARLTVRGIARAPGPRLIALLGLDEAVRSGRQLLAARAHRAGEAAALKANLSPYGALERQIGEGRPEFVLEALAALPQHEQGSAALGRTRALALSAIARRLAAQGKTDEALATWVRAAVASPLEAAAQDEVVALATARFQQLMNDRHEKQAFDLLEVALSAAPGSSTLRRLAVQYRYDRAIETVRKIRQRVDRKRTGLTDMRTLSELVADLESACAIGHEEARAELGWALLTLEAQSVGGKDNSRARRRLDDERRKWKKTGPGRAHLSVLAELLSDFRTAERLGSRLARGNAELVDRLLKRVRAQPDELLALAVADLDQLEKSRTPGGPTLEDLDELEDLLAHLEVCVAHAVPSAAASASRVGRIVATLLERRARFRLETELSAPLRSERGARLVTATIELRVLLEVHEDLTRALSLDPGLFSAGRLQADVREALQLARATTAGPGRPGARPARSPAGTLAAWVAVALFVFLFLWLVLSRGETLAACGALALLRLLAARLRDRPPIVSA